MNLKANDLNELKIKKKEEKYMDTERKPSFTWNIYRSSNQGRRMSNNRKAEKNKIEPRQRKDRYS